MNAHDGKAPAGLAANCRWLVNGQDVGDCTSSFINSPVLKSLEQVRDRAVLAVDEDRGLVVYRTFEDFPANGDADRTYPRTRAGGRAVPLRRRQDRAGRGVHLGAASTG